MLRPARSLRRLLLAALSRADAALARLYGWRLNPLHQSGALAVALLVVLLATGVYLLLFYRIGDPYASMERITAQAWLGRWIRTLHRYAADASLVAVGVHALRMFVQNRSWGPRVLAWVSGLVLLFVFLVCGWTGYVMVWDVQAQVMAVEGARILDVIPIFSEPLGRAFVGERPLPAAFFFLNLFLHIALPIGVGLLLWVHVSRVARPVLLPPKRLGWGVVGLLTALSVAWPIAMAPEADLFRLPVEAPYDVFYAFWIPLARAVPPWAAWAGGGGAALALLLVPVWARPRAPERSAPSVVDERLCTGCEQCALDCPWEAITMVARTGGRAGMVARVDPALCVSCGICSASCAPMGVGPPGRAGRDQLRAVRDGVAARRPEGVVVIACEHGAGSVAAADEVDGARVHPVGCAGNLHTSVIEAYVRAGASGVLVVGCPERDCWNREGPKWLHARVYEDREAELQARVDRRRVRLAQAGATERGAVRAALAAFRAELEALDAPAGEDVIDLVALCERATARDRDGGDDGRGGRRAAEEVA